MLANQNQQLQPASPQILALISDQSLPPTHTFLRKLIKQLKHPVDDNQTLLKQTMRSITSILKDPNIHPRVKYQSHRFIMYLLLLADLDVYEEFIETVYPILKVNCMYNKGQNLENRGEDFFKKSKYYTDSSTTAVQKNQIKKYGCQYIVFCLETVYQLAKWLPYDLEEDTKPTKFSLAYDSLRRDGVEFPREDNFRYYTNHNIDEIEKTIKEIQSQFQSLLGSQGKSSSIRELKMVSTQNAGFNSELKKLKASEAKKNTHFAVMQSINQGLTGHAVPPGSNGSLLQVGSGSKVSIGNKSSSKVGSGLGSGLGSGMLNGHAVGDSNDMQNKNKIFLLEQEKSKLLREIEIQRNFFENELQKQRKIHQQNIFKYEKKITKLQQQIEKMRQKMLSLESKNYANSDSKTNLQASNHIKDKTIEDLQNMNKILATKMKKLQEDLKNQQVRGQNQISHVSALSSNQSASVMSVEIQKLKKQNKSLKTKLLTECSEASEFSTKRSHTKTQNSQRQPDSLKFIGFEDARSCFQPFFSNSSSEIRIRLRKAILREKQLLYRDKIIEIGCITKLQSLNTIRLVIVFTNISQKPLFNFNIDFVCREDLTVKIIQNAKNYLQISGQTKAQAAVSVNQIDFRCLLCSVRYNIEQQVQKCAIILPISKLKLSQQQVYTPIKKSEKLKKLQKVFTVDRKILPNLHKFKDYFQQSILQVDKTGHETYHLKTLFMGVKIYVQCDEIEGQLRIAVKYYEEQDYSRAEKYLDQIVFLFLKM